MITKITIKIKIVFTSILFIPALVFMLSPVEGFAHEPVALPNAGLTPESAFYFVDKIGEALREFFTFNPDAKAHLQIDFAAERIAEIKIILETKGEMPGGWKWLNLGFKQTLLGLQALLKAKNPKEKM